MSVTMSVTSVILLLNPVEHNYYRPDLEAQKNKFTCRKVLYTLAASTFSLIFLSEGSKRQPGYITITIKAL